MSDIDVTIEDNQLSIDQNDSVLEVSQENQQLEVETVNQPIEVSIESTPIQVETDPNGAYPSLAIRLTEAESSLTTALSNLNDIMTTVNGGVTIAYEEIDVVCGVLANSAGVDTTDTLSAGQYLGGEAYGLRSVKLASGVSWDNDVLYNGQPTIKLENTPFSFNFIALGAPMYITEGETYKIKIPWRGKFSSGMFIVKSVTSSDNELVSGGSTVGLSSSLIEENKWTILEEELPIPSVTGSEVLILSFMPVNVPGPVRFSIAQSVLFLEKTIQNVTETGNLFSSIRYITNYETIVNNTSPTSYPVGAGFEIPSCSRVMKRIAVTKRISTLEIGKGPQALEGKDVKIAVHEITSAGVPGAEVDSVVIPSATREAVVEGNITITGLDDVYTGEYYLIISNNTDTADITFGLIEIGDLNTYHTQMGEFFWYYTGGAYAQVTDQKRLAFKLTCVAPCLGASVSCNGETTRQLLDQDGTIHDTVVKFDNDTFQTPDLFAKTEDGSDVDNTYAGGDALIRTEWYDKGTATFGDNNLTITATTPETGFILTPIQVGVPIDSILVSLVLDSAASNTVGIAYSTDLESWKEFGSVTSTDGIEKGLAEIDKLNNEVGFSKVFLSFFKKSANSVVIKNLSVSGTVITTGVTIPTAYATNTLLTEILPGPENKAITSITYNFTDFGYPHLVYSDGSVVKLPFDVRDSSFFTVKIYSTVSGEATLIDSDDFVNEGDSLSFTAQDSFYVQVEATLLENTIELSSPNVNADITKVGSGKFSLNVIKKQQSLDTEIQQAVSRINQISKSVRNLQELRQVLTASDEVVWNGNKGKIARMNLTENTTLERIYNVASGDTLELVVEQDATGSRTLSFGSDFIDLTGGASISATAGNKSFITFKVDGTDILITDIKSQ